MSDVEPGRTRWSRFGRNWRTVLLGAPVLAIVSVAAFRSDVFDRGDESRLAPARERHRGVTTRPLQSLTRVDIEQLLLGGEWSDTDGLAADRRLSVAQAAADFLYFRFSQSDPKRYIEWRRSEGYEFLDFDEFVADRNFTVVHRVALGAEIPAGATMESMFESFWNVGADYFGDSDRPVAIAKHPGIAFVSGRMAVSAPQLRPKLSGTMGEVGWYGANGATMRPWFRGPSRPEEMADKSDHVEVVDAGALIKYADGDTRPLVMTFARDAKRGRWQLAYVCQYNVSLDGRVSALEY